MSEERRPVWLLDIDGVLNAVARELPPSRGWPADRWTQRQVLSPRNEWVNGGGHPWTITMSQDVIDFLKKVHADGKVEIRWHTTWQAGAERVATAFSLPVFKVQDAPEFYQFSRRDWWKPYAVRRVAEEERVPVLWTDDEITYYLTKPERRELRALGVHLESPDPVCGLAPPNLERIEQWIEKVTQ